MFNQNVNHTEKSGIIKDNLLYIILYFFKPNSCIVTILFVHFNISLAVSNLQFLLHDLYR